MNELKEYAEEVLAIDRVTHVNKGGRKLRFRALVCIGDKRGSVAIATSKGNDVAMAVKKAFAKAKKNICKIELLNNRTFPYPLDLKYKSAKLRFLPAREGTGIIAGGVVRKVLDLVGVKDILTKSYGTSNSVILSQATIKALKSLKRHYKFQKDDEGLKKEELSTINKKIQEADEKKVKKEKDVKSDNKQVKNATQKTQKVDKVKSTKTIKK